MIHSMLDNEIGEEEFKLIVDQSHFEKVWDSICSVIPDYYTSYFDKIAQDKPGANVSLYIKQLINEHTKSQDKYTSIFEPSLMEEYADDADGFKGSVLSKQCLVIQRTLNSKSEALKDWKIAYRLATPQQLYDTFYNMISFAEEYNNLMSEEKLNNVDTIEGTGIDQMAEDSCYLIGVVGTGILSTVLNAIYPRTFPGQFKTGMFALYILSGKKPIEMKSGSSEFLMVKDDIRSKTGTIETDHNYYYTYETFGLYALRIYRLLDKEITERYKLKFPYEYRYVLTNDFYQHIFEINKQDIQTLLGNDDLLKFGYSI